MKNYQLIHMNKTVSNRNRVKNYQLILMIKQNCLNKSKEYIYEL